MFLTKIAQDKQVRQLICGYNDREKQYLYAYGVNGSQKHILAACCYQDNPRPMVIIVKNRENLLEWQSNLQALLPEEVEVQVLPAVDMVAFSTSAKSLELTAKRMEILGKLAQNKPVIVLTEINSAMQRDISAQSIKENSLYFESGDKLDRDELLKSLVNLGYERTEQVEHMGQFALRGGIIDIFPINMNCPVRLEFFDDTLESLRSFSVESQRSEAKLTTFFVMPLLLLNEKDEKESFLSYLSVDGIVLLDEPVHLEEEAKVVLKENEEIATEFFDWVELYEKLCSHKLLFFSAILQKQKAITPDVAVNMLVKKVTPFQRQINLFVSELQEKLLLGEEIIICMDDAGKVQYVKEILQKNHIFVNLPANADNSQGVGVQLVVNNFSEGMEWPDLKLVIYTEKDIMGRKKRHLRLPKVNKKNRIMHFTDINVGDYVVHVNYGIGKYLGIETIVLDGVHRDYLHIKYSGNDKLFVPVDQVSLLQKYIGSEGEVPHLSKMDSITWNKNKAKAKAAVEKIAKELINLYAKRKANKGYAFSEDTPWQREFEDAFPYEETADQLMAIKDIKSDMEKPVAMDRLLCGDVGFGKTEVAIRAAFKATMDGKQVAVLVPTTVLAEQHYQTFKHRLENFAPTLDVICRFRSLKEQRAIIEKVATGQIDILIGTHAILNEKKVKFANLGLLIVDEEQRFGVKQKEKIKQISENLDVLTLSATPIPRTLHMSLAGTRDMSIIETPPKDRFPIQTYVVEDNDTILRNAILREIKRGGQVYFIYNRVETIDKMYLRLSALLPEANIKIAHGQMSEALLEKAMVEFYEGKYNVLLATSIVENGLDIANANTIIIYDADMFGLSQLYQMRGRVGRSKKIAYAYFVYKKDKVLTEMAEKRLQAIKDFAELGSGFKIAMRDLEIRGAGNLLGAQQHGHIANVGFEMYCHLLEEAINELQTGKKKLEVPEPVLTLQVDAYIDGEYINDAMHKIEVYQRIVAIKTEAQLTELKSELIDRFGPLSPYVDNLLRIAAIKNKARSLGVKSVVEQGLDLQINLLPEHRVDASALFLLKSKWKKMVTLLPASNALRLHLTARTDILSVLDDALLFLWEKSKKERMKK